MGEVRRVLDSCRWFELVRIRLAMLIGVGFGFCAWV